MEKPRIEQSGIELQSLALLMEHWAQNEPSDKRWRKLQESIPMMRSAVLHKAVGGRKPLVPAELQNDEKKNVLWLVERLRRDACTGSPESWRFRIEGTFNEQPYVIDRPYFGGPLIVENGQGYVKPGKNEIEIFQYIDSTKYKPVEYMLKKRLGIKQNRTVKGKQGDRRRERHVLLRHLASILLDLASLSQMPEVQRRIMDALFAGGYDEFMLYYLAQLSQAAPPALALVAPEREQLLEVCDLIQGDRPRRFDHVFTAGQE